MNVYEAMRWQVDGISAEAQRVLIDTAKAYDALAPDWSNAPEWAQWYAIDANGESAWYEEEPAIIDYLLTAWGPLKLRLYNAPIVALPRYIDWRVCKWQRPEVTK